MKLKRPVLIGGLGLTAGLWLLDAVDHSPVDGSLVMGALALGSGLWWLRKRWQPQPELTVPQLISVDREAVEQALTRVDSLVDKLISELPESLQSNLSAEVWQQIESHRQQRRQILTQLDRTDLTLGLVGHKATGKTALLQHLQAAMGTDSRQSLSFAETSWEEDTLRVDRQTDLILFLITGDLTDSEWQSLQRLITDGHQVLLVFNKQDQYQPMDRELVLNRVKSRVQPMGIEVVAIATVPNPIKVRRHADTGAVTESLEYPAPDTQALTQRLTTLLTTDASQLVMATGLRQAQALKQSVGALLNQYRRQKALPVIEQMQWLAAGTAFANPLATLDLLAAVAINGQLVLDLGAIYGHRFSLDQAKAAAGTLAELTVKLGLVELSTQVLGSLLKGHAVTYVAGGALQGVSAAYLTRLAGLAMIDFFEEQTLLDAPATSLSFDALGERLQTLFQQARQGLGLQAFVTQALGHLPSKVAA
jgi:uncharacterized protein (DUF697 family)